MPSGVPIVRIEVAPQSKPWWKSRTLIVNAVALMLIAAEAHLQLLKALLPVDIYTLAAFALPVLNAALRALTAVPLNNGPARDNFEA